jgi:hypothetical protein
VKFLKCLADAGLTLIRVFEAIQLGAPNGRLLPNLQRLVWTHSDKNLLPFVDLFLGPNINMFVIGPVKDNAHYSVLASVAHKYPALRGVSITHLDPDLYED